MNPVLKDQVEALEMSLNILPPKDVAFANSLISSFKKYGGLSPKQVPWVKTLIDRALGVVPVPPKAADVGDVSGVYALFAKAKAKLKFPKIRLQIGDLPLVLALAGPKSKYQGSIQLSDGEKFGYNRYFGRVDADGKYVASMKEQDVAPIITGVLKALADDPLKVASEYGKLTGYCSFCGKTLSDPQSAAAGFGPVCAAKWGLKAEYKAAEKVLA